jgi:ABC-type sugar transport system ATPase subunit
VADRLIIMRRAKKVAERITAETTPDEVVGLIVGSIPGDYEDREEKRSATSTPVTPT